MSTVYNSKDTIKYIQKHLKNSDAIIKCIWGKAFQKPLDILVFIDGYNHSINGINLAD